MRGAFKPLPRLNGRRLAFVSASVFVFSLVHATMALAKSPDWGQGAGTSQPPSAPLAAMNGESVAYAVPRNAPPGGVEITLPQPLAPSDVALYQRILRLQENGAYAEADRVIGRLGDTSLLGSVLAERYLSPGYITSPAELTAWWSRYASEPEAAAIYQLMQHKLSRAALPPPPQTALLPETTITPAAAAMPVFAPDSAVWHQRFLSGLNAWERGDISTAAAIFAATAQIPGISDDDRAASQFWAARAALRLKQPEKYLDWLHQAAWASTSFYGMLAGKLLGQGMAPAGIAATLTEADVLAVDALPAGHRAFALLQIGEPAQAALSLRALWPQMQQDPALARAVMAVAARAGLVDVTIALAGSLPSPVDEIAGARLPLPALHPAGGFTVDPALVYALTRTESGFNARAVSRCGARGLMQLMPQTAATMRRGQGVDGALSDPSANLALGQAYLRYLGAQPGVNNNLLAVLAGYNAGPNAAAAWSAQLSDTSDPLLFVERIPNNETRRFVRQVMADSWLYAAQIGIKPESLTELAQGDYPRLNLNIYTASAD